MGRDISKVIKAIYNSIPSKEVLFRKDLQNLSDKLFYAAPEILGSFWSNLDRIVNRYIAFTPYDQLDAQWKKEVVDILRAKNGPISE